MDDRTFNDPRTAAEWISVVEGSRLRDGDLYPQLREWVSRISPETILEIGSGQGVCSDKIDLAGRRYSGVEPSPLLLARAKELYGFDNRNFVTGNIYQLPCPDESYDAAYSVAVWHLLSDLDKAAMELHRVLKKGGHFMIVTANPGGYSLWTDSYTQSKLEGRRFEGKVEMPDKSISTDVLYLHTREEITKSFEVVGLGIRETKEFRTSDKSNGEKYFISFEGRRG